MTAVNTPDRGQARTAGSPSSAASTSRRSPLASTRRMVPARRDRRTAVGFLLVFAAAGVAGLVASGWPAAITWAAIVPVWLVWTTTGLVLAGSVVAVVAAAGRRGGGR